jgi:beta-N-acetylhexosaminidase
VKRLVIIAGLLAALAVGCSSEPEPDPELDRMIGQMLMVGFRGTSVDADHPVVRDIRDRHLGGVILFDRDVALGRDVRNILSPQQLRRLTADLQAYATTPLLIAVDQEGGHVQRLSAGRGFAETPSAAALGRKPVGATLAAGRQVGAMLSEVGVNLDLAPVLDVNVDPRSPAIGALERSFSSDPHEVAEHGAAFLSGLHEEGVLGCVKHFPGHGSARSDSHLGLPDVSETWSPRELEPFAAVIHANLADAVMTAHLYNAQLDDRYPATLSRKVIGDTLRGTMGYHGVVISDDMQMAAIAEHFGREEAVRLAIEAGVDILLFGNNLKYEPDVVIETRNAIRRMVERGEIPRERIERSARRIEALKARLADLAAGA